MVGWPGWSKTVLSEAARVLGEDFMTYNPPSIT